MLFQHIPVLPTETIHYLNPRSNGIFVDGTLGGGGHSRLILEKIGPKGRLIGIDQDSDALQAATSNLSRYKSQITLIKNNFRCLSQILDSQKIDAVNGILLDLGVSSYQLETPERGFSFRDTDNFASAPLDMRMDTHQQVSAYEVVNKYTEQELSDLIFRLGEEPFARRIAHRIILERQKQPLKTTDELLAIIKTATPPAYRYSRRHGHYASKVFRALRMEVNQELPAIEEVIPQAISHLKHGGRLVIITFHSLEDRIVKHKFRAFADQGRVALLTKKPVLPSADEVETNPKSASAKLRAVEKL